MGIDVPVVKPICTWAALCLANWHLAALCDAHCYRVAQCLAHQQLMPACDVTH